MLSLFGGVCVGLKGEKEKGQSSLLRPLYIYNNNGAKLSSYRVFGKGYRDWDGKVRYKTIKARKGKRERKETLF